MKRVQTCELREYRERHGWTVAAGGQYVDIGIFRIYKHGGGEDVFFGLESYLASGLSRSMVFASGDGPMDRTHV